MRAPRLDPARRGAGRGHAALDGAERILDARGGKLGLDVGVDGAMLQRLKAPELLAELDPRVQVVERQLERAPGHPEKLRALGDTRRVVGVAHDRIRCLARGEPM